MASSSEAFRRFESWKKSKTVLRVTVLTKGGVPETLTGLIMALDEEFLRVAFARLPSHALSAFDLTGTRFTVGMRVVEVSRSPEDILSFEDTGEVLKVDT